MTDDTPHVLVPRAQRTLVNSPPADVSALKADMGDIKPRMAQVELHLGLNGAPKASARKGRSPRK